MDDRVREATDPALNTKLDAERLRRVASAVDQPAEVITERIRDLDRAWDVERVLEANASTLMLVGVSLGRLHSRKWLWLATVVPAFLLQHALQGWCPPLPVIRRFGVRTRAEIDVERTALKVLRGDFKPLRADGGDPERSAQLAIDMAERRQEPGSGR